MTIAQEIEKIVCPRCHAMLDVVDNFCRHCGAATGDNANGPAAPTTQPVSYVPAPSHKRADWSESRWAVLTMLFLVLGPVALPMLWRSRQFTPLWKILLTLLVLGLTAAIVWLLWYVVVITLAPLQELNKLQGM